MDTLDLNDLSWTAGVDSPGGDDCTVGVENGRAVVFHHCGADPVEYLGGVAA